MSMDTAYELYGGIIDYYFAICGLTRTDSSGKGFAYFPLVDDNCYGSTMLYQLGYKPGVLSAGSPSCLHIGPDGKKKAILPPNRAVATMFGGRNRECKTVGGVRYWLNVQTGDIMELAGHIGKVTFVPTSTDGWVNENSIGVEGRDGATRGVYNGSAAAYFKAMHYGVMWIYSPAKYVPNTTEYIVS